MADPVRHPANPVGAWSDHRASGEMAAGRRSVFHFRYRADDWLRRFGPDSLRRSVVGGADRIHGDTTDRTGGSRGRPGVEIRAK